MTFTEVFGPSINDAGDVYFTGTATGGTPTAPRRGLWRNSAGQNTALALAGVQTDLGPGVETGTTFAFFNSPEVNLLGHGAFTAKLAGPEIVAGKNDRGLWGFSPGGLRLIGRLGDTFDVDPAGGVDLRIIQQVALASQAGGAVPSAGADGRVRSLNDSDDIVFFLRFTDGSEGIFTTNLVPEPTGALMGAAAVVASCSFTAPGRAVRYG